VSAVPFHRTLPYLPVEGAVLLHILLQVVQFLLQFAFDVFVLFHICFEV
jgi:hypothetical protein